MVEKEKKLKNAKKQTAYQEAIAAIEKNFSTSYYLSMVNDESFKLREDVEIKDEAWFMTGTNALKSLENTKLDQKRFVKIMQDSFGPEVAFKF